MISNGTGFRPPRALSGGIKVLSSDPPLTNGLGAFLEGMPSPLFLCVNSISRLRYLDGDFFIIFCAHRHRRLHGTHVPVNPFPIAQYITLLSITFYI